MEHFVVGIFLGYFGGLLVGCMMCQIDRNEESRASEEVAPARHKGRHEKNTNGTTERVLGSRTGDFDQPRDGDTGRSCSTGE